MFSVKHLIDTYNLTFMRTSALQYLYLQKPVSTVIFVCLFSILPWIATGDFSTKGEPREAAVVVSMLETGNWTLPIVYADEFAYKPPMAHWLMAACSLPQDYVSELTARFVNAQIQLCTKFCRCFVLASDYWPSSARSSMSL